MVPQGPQLMKGGHDKLCNASQRFLQEDSFGIPQIEDIMEAIFGDYTSYHISRSAVMGRILECLGQL